MKQKKTNALSDNYLQELCHIRAQFLHTENTFVSNIFVVYFSAPFGRKRSTTQNDYSTTRHRCLKILWKSVFT